MDPEAGKKRSVTSRFLPRVSAIHATFIILINRTRHLLFSPSRFSHFTLPKVTKGFLGFLPIAFASYSLGVYLSNPINYSQFVLSLESEDQIYALLDAGHPVIAMHYVTGELLCEVMTPVFAQSAYQYSQ